MKTFLAELKRRRVYRVAIVYAAVAFVIWQAVEIAVPALRLPEWALTLIVVLTIVGFPIAVVLAWAFDITPEGVRRTERLATDVPNQTIVTIAGFVVLALVVISAWFLFQSTRQAPSLAAKWIAVLPFTNMSAEPENEYFSDGITDDIITHLSKIADLDVISRTTVMRYKGTELSLKEIGEELGVATILEGGVQRVGDRVRINAQLIDAQTDAHLWAESYDRELTDIFVIQTEVAERIVEALEATLTADERARIEKAPTEDMEAYDLYLRGRYFLNQRGEGIRNALTYFERALERDPEYARAYAGVADCYSLLGFYHYLRPKDAFPEARAAALRALELDESLDEAHTSLGFVKIWHDWDGLGAAADYKRALELNPNSPQALHWYAATLNVLRRPDEAVAQVERAVLVDPLSVMENAGFAWTLIGARRYAEARTRLQRAIELDPDFALAHWLLGEAHVFDSRIAESLTHFQKAVDLSDRYIWFLASLGYARGLHGDDSEARAILAELTERSNREYVSPFFFAIVHLGLGEKGKTLDYFEDAFEERSPHLAACHYHPFNDALRSEPRFIALVERIGLADQSLPE
jgi:TolB-like protein/Flp pilus assembly protein TadD